MSRRRSRAGRERATYMGRLTATGGTSGARQALALRDLTAAGVVLSADVGPGLTRYERGETFHHHFVCRSCGAVLDVACVVGEKQCLLPSGAQDGIPRSPVPQELAESRATTGHVADQRTPSGKI